MRNRAALLLAFGFCFLLSRPVWAANEMKIEASGDIWYEKDGSIGARGTPNHPLLATLPDYEISAGELRYNAAKQTGEASGGVIWRYRNQPERREIRADKVSFALLPKSLTAAGSVQLIKGDFSFRADKLTYNLAARTGEAAGAVRLMAGRYQLSGKKLELSPETCQLTGDPAASWEGWRLTASVISYAIAEGLVIASGPVSFGDETYRGTSDAMRLDTKNNLLLLIGAAQIVHGTDLLSGDEIAYDPATGRISIKGQAKASLTLDE